MNQVFISYSRVDEPFLKGFLTKFNASRGGHNEELFWIDQDDLRGGEEWQAELNKAISEAKVVLFFVSYASLNSQYCQDEIQRALDGKLTIIPVLLRRDYEKDYDSLPEYLRALLDERQYIDCTDGLDTDNVEDIRKALEEHLEQPVKIKTCKFLKQLLAIIPKTPVALTLLITTCGLFIAVIDSDRIGPFLFPENAPLNSVDYTVLVAGFGYQTDTGVIHPDGAPADTRNAIDTIYQGIISDLSQLETTGQLDIILEHDDRGNRYLIASSEEMNETEARALAEELNLDVIIYGNVQDVDSHQRLTVYFLINNQTMIVGEEVDALATTLSTSIDYFGGDQNTVANIHISDRVSLIRYYSDAIALYFSGDYEQAGELLSQAITVEESLQTNSPDYVRNPVLYIHAGNNALQLRQYNLAIQYFNEAIEADYTRGYIGRGFALLLPVQDIFIRYSADLTIDDLASNSYDQCVRPIPDVVTFNTLQNSQDINQLISNNQERVFMAIACYNYALATPDLNPYYQIRAWAGLGRAYEWLTRTGGDFSADSVSYYEKVIQGYASLAPQEQEEARVWLALAHGGLAYHFNQANMTEEAICNLNTAVDLLDDNMLYEALRNDYIANRASLLASLPQPFNDGYCN